MRPRCCLPRVTRGRPRCCSSGRTRRRRRRPPDAEIARHSSRSFVAVSTVIGIEELESLRAEAAALSAGEIVEAAREALRAIAGT